MSKPVRSRFVLIAALPVLLAAAGTGCSSQGRTQLLSVSHSAHASFSVPGGLFGVAAISASDAWAVGYNSGYDALMAHWNGRAWKTVKKLPDSDLSLFAVAASSLKNVWAVGYDGGTSVTDRWNGTAWTGKTSLQLTEIRGLAVLSRHTAWAGGETEDETSAIARWNGSSWALAPHPSVNALVMGVAATSATNAWAVTESGRILHWNGAAWTLVKEHPAYGLNAVTATSAANAWAVGWGYRPRGPVTEPASAFTVHWNGTTWKYVPTPVTSNSVLNGLAATSATNVWAVGRIGKKALILHWNGKKWARTPVPASTRLVQLESVAAISATDAWAVGIVGVPSAADPQTTKTIILHWNGTTWK